MNEMTVFNNPEFGEIKNIEQENKNKYTGFFYILEWDNFVKIGSTKNPYQRLMALKRSAETYGQSQLGRIAFSVPHTNYKINEKKLHKNFSMHRKEKSELFDLSFDEVVSNLPNDMEYLDESEQIDKQAEDFLNGIKKWFLGGQEFERN